MVETSGKAPLAFMRPVYGSRVWRTPLSVHRGSVRVKIARLGRTSRKPADCSDNEFTHRALRHKLAKQNHHELRVVRDGSFATMFQGGSSSILSMEYSSMGYSGMRSST